MSVRYLLAKYIPDIQRLEPVNIGVIVWSNGSARARFYGEIHGRPGQINGSHVPRHWPLPTYKQWVGYWRQLLDLETIIPANGGAPVSRSSDEFIETLLLSNRGNFMLADGGVVLDDVLPESLVSLAEDLFIRLVEDPSKAEERNPTLDQKVNTLVEEAGLSADQNFRSHYDVDCPVGSVFERFEFSYAYQNGNLHRLYQTIAFGQNPKANRKNVHDSCWMFEKVETAGLINRNQGAAIVSVAMDQFNEPETQRIIQVLASTTRVFNLDAPELLLREFTGLASFAEH